MIFLADSADQILGRQLQQLPGDCDRIRRQRANLARYLSGLNDGMAGHLCRSSQLRFLDIGAPTETGAVLKAISKMRQLTSLDLWATAIDEADIDVLTQLPNPV